MEQATTVSEVLRVYRINDGGGVWWYVAANAEEAMRDHVRLQYTETGVPMDEGDPTDGGCLPDDKVLTVVDYPEGPTARPAKEWAQTGRGFLATTEF